MKLEVLRFSSQVDSTHGALFEVTELGKEFLCYTLEDEARAFKVRGETRIPEGIYEIKLRKTGGFHSRYSKRYRDIHRGMLHITDVPNFEFILIHTGNTDEHTDGCLIVGDSQENNSVVTDGFVGKSRIAYKRIYPRIAKALENDEEVTIQYINYDE